VVNEVDVADLAAAMRRVVAEPAWAAAVGARASEAVRGGHTWDRAAGVAARRIERLVSGGGMRAAA
jgi:hypothetical protein